jgi:hypothetical protein
MRDDRDALIESSLSLKGAVPRAASPKGARILTRESAQALPTALPWPLELSLGVRTGLALFGCVALACVLGFHALGARAIFSPAEARYSLIAREMVESGDWIQPRLNHVRYDEKPPLLYWAIGASYGWLGGSELSSRVPSALAYVATTALTFGIAYELVGPAVAPLAALVYATSVGAFLFGRFVFTDSLLVFATTLALYAFCRIVRRGGELRSVWIFYLAVGLAGMTKGLVGLVLPAALVCGYWALFEDRSFAKRLKPVLGAAVTASVFLPWHVAMALRDPAFLDFYVVNEHLRRFLHTREPVDYVSQSVTGFWVATCFWLLPWALFLPGALVSAVRSDRRRLAIPLLWSACVIVFFTLTESRMEYYAMPAFPSVAVLVGAYWNRLFRPSARSGQLLVPMLALLAISLCAVPGLFLFPGVGSGLLSTMVRNVDGYYREYFANHPAESLAMVHEMSELARPFVLLLFLVSGGVALLAASGSRRLAFALLVAGTIPCLGIVDLGMRLITPDRSQREFAQIIADHWDDGAKLVVVGAYEDLCGVTYYTHRVTHMLDPNPEDLLFGYRKGDAADLFLTQESLRREWASGARVFVLSDKRFDLPGAVVLAESPRDVLRTNHPL